MERIYSYLHIPRTGGSYVIASFPNHLDRVEDDYLVHYSFTEYKTTSDCFDALIPYLQNRSLEQQKKIKVLSGHSLYNNSHHWLRVPVRENFLFTFIRHPIARVLSSFNYRYTIQVGLQDSKEFSSIAPKGTAKTCIIGKNSDDYDTLYEYYCDFPGDQNLQTKWILKTFAGRDSNGNWQRHPEYLVPEQGWRENGLEDLTWPQWFWDNTDIDYWQMTKNLLSELWFFTTNENYAEILPKLCQAIDVPYRPQKARLNESKIKKWTMEEVMQQPDIRKLIAAESADFALYEEAKKQQLPF